MTTLAFVNAQGGVGTTALVSHLAWMFAERGVPVLAVDLDPQANLTSMFVSEERTQALWDERGTIAAAVQPLLDRTGDIGPAHTEPVAPGLHVVPGDLHLARFEDRLAESWEVSLTGDVGAFRGMSAFHRILARAAAEVAASVVLIDLGPNLGPLNRAALLAADHLVVPVAPDRSSLRGMESLGPTLRSWRAGWEQRGSERPDHELSMPSGRMEALGYVVMSFGVRYHQPLQAHDRWMARIPALFREAMLGVEGAAPPSPDPFQLASLRHYPSLLPMAIAARKPMFRLQPADGARGAHLDAVRACYDDFHRLAVTVGDRLGLPVP